MVTDQIKQRIIRAITDNRPNFSGSDAKYATSLGINKAVYSRLKKGEIEKVMAEHKWITLARQFDIQFGDQPKWVIAATPVFKYITQQLSYCQREATAGIFCDKADIGKTTAAKEYVRNNRNVVYIDCSQVKTKRQLVRKVAREFGVDHTGKYSDVYADLIYYIKVIDSPLIILDETGDLDYPAFLELKALWNATEGYCGWYMMGADGLEAKINRSMANKKVGYAELFRRYGSRYQHVVPAGKDERKVFLDQQAALVIKANFPTADVQQVINKCIGYDRGVVNGASLTRVRTEITKLKRAS